MGMFSVECGACKATFKLPQEIYERRIVGRKVALRCKKCKAEIAVDGTKFGPAPADEPAAPANEPAAPAPDPNFSFVPQVPAATAPIQDSPPATARSSLEALPRDTSWFPAGGSEPAPRIVVEAPVLPALPPQPPIDPRPESEPPGRPPMETPRVPIALGREAMPTPRNLEAQIAATAAEGFGADEPPSGMITAVMPAVSVLEALAADAQTAVDTKEKPQAAPAPVATPPTPEVARAEAKPASPRAAVAPRPAGAAKAEQPSSPRAAAKPLDPVAKRELPSRPQQEQAKRELLSRPKAAGAKPELPSRPKQEQEPPKRDLPSRPREQATRRDLPSRPKHEAPQPEAKAEPPPRPKQESKPQIEPPARPKQESKPQIEPGRPLRPRQESRPELDLVPPPRPKLESRPQWDAPPSNPSFRPRMESDPRLPGEVSSVPVPPERVRALAAEAVAKALASTEQAPIEASPAVAPAALAVSKEPVQALPAERPISLPPVRPSLPPGRRAATIAALAGALVIGLVVLGWMLSTVSSRSTVPPVPSGLASVTAPAPPPPPAPEPEEDEDEPAAHARAPSPPAGSVAAPTGSAPGLLEQLVQNLNSQTDDKSFDREAALKALDMAGNRASRCRSKGDPSGSVTVLVIFNPAGTVKETKVVGSSYDGSATARCVASRMAQTRIKPFEGPPKTLAKSVVIP